MNQINQPPKLFAITALALGLVTLQVHAQDQLVDTFDTEATVSAWTPTWGTTPVLSFSTNGSPGGALRVEADYFTGAGTWEQAVILKTLTTAVKASDYETVSIDVKADPSSLPTTGNQYGYFEVKYGSAGTSFGGVNITSTNWTRLKWPVPAGTPDISQILIQIGSGDFTGKVIWELDNLSFNAPRVAINRFDDATEADVWTPEWGTAVVLSFDAEDAGGGAAGSGSLKASADYFTPASDGWEQMVFKHIDFDPAFAIADYAGIAVDVKVDPSSVPTPANQYGYYELKYGSGGVSYGGVNLSATNWTTYSWPIAAGTPDLVQLRVQNGNGSFVGPITFFMDNLVLIKKVGAPTLAILTSPIDDVKRTDVVLNWLLSDGATAINVNSVKLSLDGKLADTAKVVTTKTANGATVVFDDTGNEWAAGEHTWSLQFTDSSTPANSVSGQGTFVVNPYPTEGTFVIETEDFNYDTGKYNPMKGTPEMDVDVMPYLGGAYDTLGATAGIDYNGNDENDSDLYRTELDATGQNAVNLVNNIGGRWGSDRGLYTATVNYRKGWVDNGEWLNYTRTFPATNYNVWGAFSRDGRDPNQVSASLALVSGNITTSNQTAQILGTFSGPGTGGWGRNILFPMKDSSGAMAVVTLGGLQTVRANIAGGDFDYLVFVPTAPGPPKITGATRTGNTVTITWTGGGVLESAPSLSGPWTSTNDSDGSYSEAATATIKFFRVHR
ncbi:MAG TPA: hypothetical protein VL361_09715 [Candidatus Limnocylindrales bacterium]|nr:hypothetical protein [Candidatus Limnocylindrales bacterium]